MTAARVIACPNCGGTIALKAAGYTIQVACQYCGSELDVTTPDVRLITKYQHAASAKTLPLGARGTVQGVEWEVIGWLERSDDEARWTEYLLFNPYAGYRWLIEADVEWSLGTALTSEPVNLGSQAFEYDGLRFTADYSPVATTTDAVVGEFYWRVSAGDTVEATTFSAGDVMLSWESSRDEVNWTLIEPLPGGDSVADAFSAPPDPAAPGPGGAPRGPGQFGRKTASTLRSRSGAGAQAKAQGLVPVRRASDGDDLSAMIVMGMATCFLILIVGLVFGMGRTAVTQSFNVYTGQPEKTVMLGTITLRRPYQAVTITARGDQFVNKWVDLDYSLVDRRTQRAIDAYGIVEYYSGRDSDGNWTEGSRSETTKFAGVPAGTYDVMVDAKATAWSSSPNYSSSSSSYASGYAGSGWLDPPEMITLRFKVAPGGVFLSNLLMFTILIFAPVAFWMWRKARAATERGYR
ncbi:DUF4178 domain-containing protein [Sphingomonas astaxanthinifaciens]|uniref:DUF4178 domain-containing protein n=1 Tax=Sphingomonas astaxanthinifaciens DSM 22298 TaxID=1123267 RepID=A0ABQ5Z6Z3_9SPHN|nr:DUF4178 domain-containing protein [Sphingomonas astaxanthinifaciens]GLR48538.1 hypothetical protein GCM10007925_22550 [Sphingomonas astaxanthinifaciens DSM 22298]